MSDSLFDVSGKVMLFTGSPCGLGGYIIRFLVESGVRLAVIAQNLERMKLEAFELEKAPGQVMVLRGDATRSDQFDQAVAMVVEHYGDIDVLINCAGVGAHSPVTEHIEPDGAGELDTDLESIRMMSEAVARRMIAQGGDGSIINLTSTLDYRVNRNTRACADYMSAVSELTRTLALEFASWSVRVNAIASGYINTSLSGKTLRTAEIQSLLEQIPQRRLGKPEELIGVLLLLASGASSYMTGNCLVVDGGYFETTIQV